MLEGMACGCVPVCLAMRSGIPELVQHSVSGLIVGDREDSTLHRQIGRVFLAGITGTDECLVLVDD